MRVLFKNTDLRIVDSGSSVIVERAARDAMGEPIWVRVAAPSSPAQREVYEALLRVVLFGDEEEV